MADPVITRTSVGLSNLFGGLSLEEREAEAVADLIKTAMTLGRFNHDAALYRKMTAAVRVLRCEPNAEAIVALAKRNRRGEVEPAS